MIIQQIKKDYFDRIDSLDLDLIISHVIQKPREFVLTHPEFEISEKKIIQLKKLIKRRIKAEPLAYIIGHKEFFGFDFLVNRHTLIPRPETELMIEKVLKEKLSTNTSFLDIGTGSGNIIISLAKIIKNTQTNFFAIDISKEAILIAKKNSKQQNVNDKINFFVGSLLEPINRNISKKLFNKIILTANLPYLSKKIYISTEPTVKNFEPESALLSSQLGLSHYKKLLKQISKLKYNFNHSPHSIICFLEISPEQKSSIGKIIKDSFPESEIKFYQDLAQKWRLVRIKI